MSELAHKATNSIIWTAIHKIGSMSISFITNMILARLLSPDDFGIIGIILVFINLGNVFIDAGFGSALIQKKDSDDIDYSTVFYWNLLISIVLYLMLFTVSGYISEYYRIDILQQIFRIIGLILIINALSIIQTVRYKIQLNFKPLAVCFIVSSIIAAVTAISLALNNYGVWSLVWFQIIQSLLNTIFLWFLCSWRPKIAFSFSSFKVLFGFGFYLLLSSLLTSLCNQIQSLFIGKVCSTATLGYYTQAKNMESAPTNVIYSVVGQVAFPIFSKYQDDKNKLINLNIRLNTCISLFVMPLMTILIVYAKPIITLVLSEKWLIAVPYFQILCVAGTASCFIDINNYSIAAIGKSDVIFKWSLIKNIIGIIIISVGSIAGIYGILIGVTSYYYIGYIIFSLLIKKYFSVGVIEQIKYIKPVLLISITLGIAMYFVNLNIPDTYINEAITCLIYICLYYMICYVFRIKALIWIKEQLCNVINRHK